MLGLLTVTRSGVQRVDFFGAEIMHNYCIRVTSKCTVKRKHKKQLLTHKVLLVQTRIFKLCTIRNRYLSDSTCFLLKIIACIYSGERPHRLILWIFEEFNSLIVSISTGTLYLEVTGNRDWVTS